MKQPRYSAKWYRERLNRLEKQLNSADYQYFDELRGCLSFAGLNYDETRLNQILFGMLQDLIDANQQEISAVNLFGKQPKQMADEILITLPPIKWFERFKLYFLVAGITWIIQFFRENPVKGTITLNLLQYLLLAFFFNLFVVIIFKLIKNQFYQPKSFHWINIVLLGLLFATLGSSFYLLGNLKFLQLNVTLPFMISLGLTIMIMISLIAIAET